MVLEKADSITECPSIEEIWHSQRLDTNTTESVSNIILSRSDSGPYIHIFCPEGSHVVGPTMITCLKGGVWSDETEPTCSTSTLYGIPESDMLLIGVLAGCGAIVIITLTIVLAHLLCFRNRLSSPTSSVERLDRLSGNYPPNAVYGEDAMYSISGPKYPTLQGPQFTSGTSSGYLSSHLSNSLGDNTSLSNFSLPRYYLQSATEPYYVGHIPEDGSGCSPYGIAHMQNLRNESEEYGVANDAFRDEYPVNYNHNWENEMCMFGPEDDSAERLPGYSTLDRTML